VAGGAGFPVELPAGFGVAAFVLAAPGKGKDKQEACGKTCDGQSSVEQRFTESQRHTCPFFEDAFGQVRDSMSETAL